MIKVLIVENDFEYIKNILNKILYKLDEINVKFIATTIKDALDIIWNNNIDLILLDFNLLDGKGIEVLKKIKNNNSLKKPDIIVMSEEVEQINGLKKEKDIYAIINKLQNEDYIYNVIKQYIWKLKYIENNKNIRETIIFYLKNMGFNFKYKGTIYIFEAIEYIYKCNNMDLLDNLEKNVYKYIALKNKKSINNIKTNIIKTANLTFIDKKSIGQYTPKSIITDITIQLMK